jgi:hypothetical protein
MIKSLIKLSWFNILWKFFTDKLCLPNHLQKEFNKKYIRINKPV